MSKRKDIRRLAMQVLYQIDVTGETDAEVIFEGLDEEHDAADVRTDAVELAVAAWGTKQDADAKVSAVAADWPTHRQPPVDRAILRLAYHEMTTGRAHPRIVINEAIDLAKHYSNENAPSFINGVLDKLHKTLDLPEPQAAPGSTPAKPTPEASADDWLDDAVEGD